MDSGCLMVATILGLFGFVITRKALGLVPIILQEV